MTFLIATRKSKMALAQAQLVADLLTAREQSLELGFAHGDPVGDRDQISKLDRHGGKGGAFVAEIRADVLAGRSQCAMHSLKDMPGNEETPGLVIAAYLSRDDATDALVVRNGLTLENFEADGAADRKIGTNSIRRAALLKAIYPKAEIIHFRGAADTRIRKLDEQIPQQLPDGSSVGPADAIVLATSGLERIGMSDRVSKTFRETEMLPAVGQGIVAVECAREDWETRQRLASIDNAASRTCALAERELLWILDGHCNSPIAAHARIEGSQLVLDAAVMSHDGNEIIKAASTMESEYPRELGRRVGFELLKKGAARLIDATRP